jgi:hypothetical protein
MRQEKINPMEQLPFYGTASIFEDAYMARKLMKIEV